MVLRDTNKSRIWEPVSFCYICMTQKIIVKVVIKEQHHDKTLKGHNHTSPYHLSFCYSLFYSLSLAEFSLNVTLSKSLF